MSPKLINRLLLAPGGLWLLAMLVLPLVVSKPHADSKAAQLKVVSHLMV